MGSVLASNLARRAAAGISRRESLATMTGAGLAAVLGGPLTADAGKSGKKARKRCKRQVGQCRGYFTNVCGSEAGCPEAFACCSFLAQCNAGAFVSCLGELET